MKVDLSKIKDKIAQLNGENKTSNSSDVQMWKPDVGEYTVRCLHWPDGVCNEGEMFLERHFYYGIGRYSILAPEQFDKPDPIKDFRNKLYQSGSAEDKLLAKKLWPKMRCYMPIVVLEGKDADPSTALVYSFGSYNYQKLLGYFLNEKVQDYMDPYEGFNFKVIVSQPKGIMYKKIEFEIDGLSGRQPILTTDKGSPDKKAIDALLKTIPDMSKIWTLRDYNDIKSQLKEWLSAGLDSDDSAGTQKVSRKAAASDDLDDLVNEVAAETKKTKTKVSKAKTVVEEDDNDDDDDNNDYSDLDAAFASLENDD